MCGKKVWITPSNSPSDATCPHCGALLWFETALKGDAIKDLADRGIDVDLDAEGEITNIRFCGDWYDDSTVPQLARIQDVETMDIWNTRISETGAQRLRVLMPSVKIIHDEQCRS